MAFRPTKFPPELEYQVRVAAAFYNMTPSRYIRTMLQRSVDELADHNPNIKAQYDYPHIPVA